jgi:rifampicin phosphotransferase
MGLDLWFSFLKIVRPQFESEGSDGLLWNLGGRQYLNMSNFLTTIGARKLMSADPSVARVLESIDLEGEYMPAKMPTGLKGVFWTRLKQLRDMVPNLIYAFFAGDKAMIAYDRASEAFFALCHDDDYMRDETLDKVLLSFLNKYRNEIASNIGGLMLALFSSWRLDRIFSQVKDAEDLLVSLTMDLPTNPTSAMGHAMVSLASYPEIQQTKTGEEFVQKLKETDGSGFSDEFMTLYNDYTKRYGRRGIKEIDVATPRTSEREADLFQQSV